MVQPDFDNPAWVESGGPGEYCFENPSSSLCEDVPGAYEYDVSLPANAAFLGIFSLTLIGFIVIWAITRRASSFNVSFILGLMCEIIGYIGRVVSSLNKWNDNAFLVQICCLTIGPAFMAAGIYLCLRQIVIAFGPQNSRVPPKWYTRIFIPCDIISLILQAVGGALASIGADSSDATVDLGSNIMLGGLAFQVATMTCFIATASDFAWRVYRRSRAAGGTAATLDQAADLVAVRASRRFKAFLFALSLACVCILTRSAFRVAELSQGWEGPIMAHQGMFIGFEGVLIVVAVLALLIFHPAVCMAAVVERSGGFDKPWKWKKAQKKPTAVEAKAEVASPASFSDV